MITMGKSILRKWVKDGSFLILTFSFQANADIPEDKQLTYLPEEINEDNILDLKPVEQYKESVEKLINLGETPENMEDYKRSVMELLNIKVAAKAS